MVFGFLRGHRALPMKQRHDTAALPDAVTGPAGGILLRRIAVPLLGVLSVVAWSPESPAAQSAQSKLDAGLLAPIPAAPSGDHRASIFLDAERALKLGQRTRFRRLAARITDYPLYPYLVYEDLKRRLAHVGPAEVDAFLSDQADSVLASRLRRHWLKLATGEAEAAFKQAPDIWLSGHSRPRECDPVFAAWIKAGGLTRALAWERVWLAINKDNLRLARYVAGFLPVNQRALVHQWIALRSSPYKVNRLPKGVDKDIRERMRVYAVERLARSDPDAAASLWLNLERKHAFEEKNVARVSRRLGIIFARKGERKASDWLERVGAAHMDDTVAHWRLAVAVRHGDWQRALDGIPAATKGGVANAPRWRYWRARALDELGDQQGALEFFTKLATERSYYGFLAADGIDAPYEFGDQPLMFSDASLIELAATSRGRRIRALLSLKRTLDARREWHFWTTRMSEDDRSRAAKLAQRWNWHDAGILTVARTPYRDDLELRFPVAHGKEVSRYAASQRLEEAMVLALIRQESAFMADATSPKGARGLMQMLPSTGRQVARSLGTRLKRRDQLFDPATNVRFGTFYFRRLLDAHDENPVLALGAYNAGPRRVARWRPQNGKEPADIWVENVAFSETREYIKRVLAYTAVYEHRLGQTPIPLSNRMGTIRARADIEDKG
jgi:soluble lytic murein transglycosylase